MLLKQLGTLLFLIGLLTFVPSAANGHDENAHDVDDFESFNEEDEGYTTEDHIEVREQTSFVKPKALNTAKDLPPVRMLYCVSCGYKQAAEQFSNFLKEKYPNLLVEGGNYPPVAWKAYVANAVSILKMVILGIILTGTNPFEVLGFGYPTFLQQAHNNKMSVVMMIFMLFNLLEGSLIATGAFEIYLGDELIWSKLESGRVPSPPELIQLIEAQLGILGLKAPGSETAFGDFATAN